MRKANPMLKKGFSSYNDITLENRMSLFGAVNKTFMLLSLLMITSVFTWFRYYSAWSYDASSMTGFIMTGAIGGTIFALITSFKPNIAPMTAPLYALCEGLVIGSISAMLEEVYPGVVMQAVLITLSILLALLVIYRLGIIKATENFKLGVFSATFGVMLVYLFNFILGFFGIQIPFIHESGMLGIGISLVIIVIAALNLVLDFDFIEQGVDRGYPKYMEWYAAFGLMVTLVWLYIEILRLLVKLRSRD